MHNILIVLASENVHSFASKLTLLTYLQFFKVAEMAYLHTSLLCL